MYKILVSDPLEKTGLAMLRESGHEVYEMPEEERPRLAELIADVDALVVRSGTQVTAELLAAGRRLRVVGRAGIGVDNVDIAAATERGILVINAPTANLISATEHTFALLLALVRKLAAADHSIKAGEWNRKAFVGTELQRKTLGVVGFGRIGQQVARRARAFDMEVVAYDPVIPADYVRRLDVEPMGLEELLAASDMVTLHVPMTDGTRNLLNAERIAGMKPGAFLVNCARGGVVDEKALLEALESGHLGGAAIDVFAKEPLTDFALAGHPRVVATPHVGAQTREAQVRISTETASMVVAALEGSLAVTAVNLPFRPSGTVGEPYLKLAEKLGTLAASQVEGAFSQVHVRLAGVPEELQTSIGVAALMGVMAPFHENVNYVNAELLARSQGLEVVRSVQSTTETAPLLVEVRLDGEGGSVTMAGTLLYGHDLRITSFDGYQLEFQPKGRILVMCNQDVPGVVGRLGTTLGEAGVNIAEIHLARHSSGNSDQALAVVRIDQDMPGEALEALRALPEILRAETIDLGQ
jgi:D-3-phosphoglycerate dehydrogenase